VSKKNVTMRKCGSMHHWAAWSISNAKTISYGFSLCYIRFFIAPCGVVCVDATLAFQPQVLKYSQHIFENKQKYLENDPHNFIGTFTGIHATGTITLL